MYYSIYITYYSYNVYEKLVFKNVYRYSLYTNRYIYKLYSVYNHVTIENLFLLLPTLLLLITEQVLTMYSDLRNSIAMMNRPQMGLIIAPIIWVVNWGGQAERG